MLYSAEQLPRCDLLRLPFASGVRLVGWTGPPVTEAHAHAVARPTGRVRRLGRLFFFISNRRTATYRGLVNFKIFFFLISQRRTATYGGLVNFFSHHVAVPLRTGDL